MISYFIWAYFFQKFSLKYRTFALKFIEMIGRLKKTRGANRATICLTERPNRRLDLDLLQKYHYDNEKFATQPWGNIARSRNPKGKYRQLFIENLMSIYEDWNAQLKTLNEPCYLKIWLNQTQIVNSQVVCGIKERIERYENIFAAAENEINFSYFTTLEQAILKRFHWEKYFDEDKNLLLVGELK